MGTAIESAGQRIKNQERIERAIAIQDELRSKSSDWNGEEEIRKWRQKR